MEGDKTESSFVCEDNGTDRRQTTQGDLGSKFLHYIYNFPREKKMFTYLLRSILNKINLILSRTSILVIHNSIREKKLFRIVWLVHVVVEVVRMCVWLNISGNENEDGGN